MKDNKVMNICYCFTGGYEPQVATSICSLCKNNANHKLAFYLLVSEVSEANKNRLKSITDKFNQRIHFFDVSSLLEELKINIDRVLWPKIVLARLFICEVLPESVGRVLYLDGDTIILNDIIDLYDLDMQNKIIGMSIEPTVNTKRLKSLGFSGGPYCNAGVLLIDLRKWRDYKCEDKILNFYKKNCAFCYAPDQDSINCVLEYSIKYLEPKYNFSDYYYDYPYWFLKNRLRPYPYFSKQVFEESKKNPSIVHYIGLCKPWRRGSPHPFAKQYLQYLSLTPFYETPQEDGWKIYFLCWRIFRTMVKPFPHLRHAIIDSFAPIAQKFNK